MDTVQSMLRELGSLSHRSKYQEIIYQLALNGTAIQGGNEEEGGGAGGGGGGGGGGGEEKPTGGGGGGEEKPSADAARLAAIEKENADLKAKAAERAKKDDEKKRAAEIEAARKGGKLEETLSDTQKKLKAAQEENEKLRKAQSDRVDRKFKALGEEEQKRLEAYRERVPIDVFADMVEEASGAGGGGSEDDDDDDDDRGNKKVTPPPTGSPMKGGKNKGGSYQPTPEAKRILDEEMGIGTKTLESLRMQKDPEGAAWKFDKPVRKFIKDMTGPIPQKMTYEAAEKRKRGE